MKHSGLFDSTPEYKELIEANYNKFGHKVKRKGSVSSVDANTGTYHSFA